MRLATVLCALAALVLVALATLSLLDGDITAAAWRGAGAIVLACLSGALSNSKL